MVGRGGMNATRVATSGGVLWTR